MIVAARAGRLAALVHGVDDLGALCGAVAGGGGWRPVGRFPVNCPRCLRRMASERWALCETPTAMSRAPLHIRRVGVEGVQRSGNSAGAMTLCGLIVGWDEAELTPERLAELADQRFCDPCLRVYGNPGLASVRQAILSAQR